MVMDWHTIAGMLSGIILTVILVPYIASIIKGPTRPNVVSWSGWMMLAGIATAIQFAEGASWSIIIPLITTISCAIIAAIAVRLGYARFTKLDLACFALGILATEFWLLAHQPLLSLLLLMIADSIFTIPTVVKTYRDPFSEPAWLWFLYVVGASIGIGASTSYDIYNLLYPVYLVSWAAVLWLLALRGRWKRI